MYSIYSRENLIPNCHICTQSIHEPLLENYIIEIENIGINNELLQIPRAILVIKNNNTTASSSIPPNAEPTTEECQLALQKKFNFKLQFVGLEPFDMNSKIQRKIMRIISDYNVEIESEEIDFELYFFGNY